MGNLMYVDLAAGTNPINIGQAFNSAYDLSGDTAVYVDTSDQLTLIDLSTEETNILDQTTRGGDLRSPPKIQYPTIDGAYVVWDQSTGQNSWELRAYSLETGKHYVLDSDEWPHQPHLRMGTLVWQSGDERSGYGIRSARIEEFEQLHELQTRDEGKEMIVWGGVAMIAAVFALVAWRRIRSRQGSLSTVGR